MPRKRKNRRRRWYQSALAAHCPPVSYHETRRARVPQDLDFEAKWFVAYTGVRLERRAEMGLRERGLQTFLPCIWQERADRKLCYQRPIFPRYLFVGMDRPMFGAVGDTDGVERLLTGSTGWPLPVPAPLLQRLQRVHNGEEEGPEPVSRETPLTPGEMVRIVEGPLAGLFATIEKSTAFLAEIATDFLGRKASATLPIAHLERA